MPQLPMKKNTSLTWNILLVSLGYFLFIINSSHGMFNAERGKAKADQENAKLKAQQDAEQRQRARENTASSSGAAAREDLTSSGNGTTSERSQEATAFGAQEKINGSLLYNKSATDCFINSALQFLRMLNVEAPADMPELARFLNGTIRTEQDNQTLRRELAEKVMVGGLQGNDDFESVIRHIREQGTAGSQQDVREFLFPLFEKVGVPKIEVMETITNSRGESRSQQLHEKMLALALPEQEDVFTVDQLILHYLNSQGRIKWDDRDTRDSDVTITRPFCQPIPSSLILSVGRFGFDGSVVIKRKDLIAAFDTISIVLPNGASEIYTPNAIICHLGNTVHDGHYVFYGKEGKAWSRFDDWPAPQIRKMTERDRLEILENCYVISYVKTNVPFHDNLEELRELQTSRLNLMKYSLEIEPESRAVDVIQTPKANESLEVFKSLHAVIHRNQKKLLERSDVVDSIWKIDREAWKLRATTRWDEESKLELLKQAEEQLQRAEIMASEEELSKTSLHKIARFTERVSQVFGGASGLAASVPEGHVQAAGAIAGTAATVGGIAATLLDGINQTPAKARETMATVLVTVRKRNFEKAKAATKQAKDAAPEIRKQAEEQEMATQNFEKSETQKTAEVVALFIKAAQQHQWEMIATDLASLDTSPIDPLLMEFGKTSPAWFIENLHNMWEERMGLSEKQLQDLQDEEGEVQKQLSAFEKKSLAAQENLRVVETEIAAVKSKLEENMQRRKILDSDLERINEALNELENIPMTLAIEMKVQDMLQVLQQLQNLSNAMKSDETALQLLVEKRATAFQAANACAEEHFNFWFLLNKKIKRAQVRCAADAEGLAQFWPEKAEELKKQKEIDLPQRLQQYLKIFFSNCERTQQTATATVVKKLVEPPERLDEEWEAIGIKFLGIEKRPESETTTAPQPVPAAAKNLDPVEEILALLGKENPDNEQRWNLIQKIEQRQESSDDVDLGRTRSASIESTISNQSRISSYERFNSSFQKFLSKKDPVSTAIAAWRNQILSDLKKLNERAVPIDETLLKKCYELDKAAYVAKKKRHDDERKKYEMLRLKASCATHVDRWINMLEFKEQAKAAHEALMRVKEESEKLFDFRDSQVSERYEKAREEMIRLHQTTKKSYEEWEKLAKRESTPIKELEQTDRETIASLKKLLLKQYRYQRQVEEKNLTPMEALFLEELALFLKIAKEQGDHAAKQYHDEGDQSPWLALSAESRMSYNEAIRAENRALNIALDQKISEQKMLVERAIEKVKRKVSSLITRTKNLSRWSDSIERAQNKVKEEQDNLNTLIFTKLQRQQSIRIAKSLIRQLASQEERSLSSASLLTLPEKISQKIPWSEKIENDIEARIERTREIIFADLNMIRTVYLMHWISLGTGDDSRRREAHLLYTKMLEKVRPVYCNAIKKIAEEIRRVAGAETYWKKRIAKTAFAAAILRKTPNVNAGDFGYGQAAALYDREHAMLLTEQEVWKSVWPQPEWDCVTKYLEDKKREFFYSDRCSAMETEADDVCATYHLSMEASKQSSLWSIVNPGALEKLSKKVDALSEVCKQSYDQSEHFYQQEVERMLKSSLQYNIEAMIYYWSSRIIELSEIKERAKKKWSTFVRSTSSIPSTVQILKETFSLQTESNKANRVTTVELKSWDAWWSHHGWIAMKGRLEQAKKKFEASLADIDQRYRQHNDASNKIKSLSLSRRAKEEELGKIYQAIKDDEEKLYDQYGDLLQREARLFKQATFHWTLDSRVEKSDQADFWSKPFFKARQAAMSRDRQEQDYSLQSRLYKMEKILERAYETTRTTFYEIGFSQKEIETISKYIIGTMLTDSTKIFSSPAKTKILTAASVEGQQPSPAYAVRSAVLSMHGIIQSEIDSSIEERNKRLAIAQQVDSSNNDVIGIYNERANDFMNSSLQLFKGIHVTPIWWNLSMPESVKFLSGRLPLKDHHALHCELASKVMAGHQDQFINLIGEMELYGKAYLQENAAGFLKLLLARANIPKTAFQLEKSNGLKIDVSSESIVELRLPNRKTSVSMQELVNDYLTQQLKEAGKIILKFPNEHLVFAAKRYEDLIKTQHIIQGAFDSVTFPLADGKQATYRVVAII